MEKGVIYCRVSSQTQVNSGSGLEGQETTCKKRTEQNNVEVVETFTDGGISGKLLSRKGLDEMITYLKHINKKFTKISYVIVDDFDRIVRDVVGRWEIKNKIEKECGATIISIKQNFEETPEGIFQQNIMMSFKQFERESNARRVRDRQRSRLLNGYRPFYQKPGYNYINENGIGKILVPDKNTSPVISEGLKMYANGIIKNQSQLKEYFNKKGIKTNQGSKIEKNFVYRILQSDNILFFAGYINYPPRGVEMIKGKHAPIIDMDTANKIIYRYENNKSYKNKNHSKKEIYEQFPLRNMLLCSTCNRPLTGAPSPNKQGNYYNYYRCMNKECSKYGKSLNANEVHNAFEEHLKGFRIKPPYKNLLIRCIEEIHSNDTDINSKQIKEKEKQLKDTNNKVDQINKKLLQTENAELISNYENLLSELLGKKKFLEAEIEELKNDVEENEDISKIINEGLNILEDPYKIRKQSDVDTKRLLTGVVFDSQIYYNKKNGITTPQIPLVYEIFTEENTSNSCLVEMAGIEPACGSRSG